MFWDADEPEELYGSPEAVLDSYNLGEIAEIQQAVRLHNVFAVTMDVPNSDERETRVFDDHASAVAWVDTRRVELRGLPIAKESADDR